MLRGARGAQTLDNELNLPGVCEHAGFIPVKSWHPWFGNSRTAPYACPSVAM